MGPMGLMGPMISVDPVCPIVTTAFAAAIAVAL